jgi:Spy/CpxP family protein refolding chaperone
MRNTTNSILTGLAILLVMCSSVDAQTGKGRGGPGRIDGDFPTGCIMNMNLSAEQRTKVQELRNAFFKDTIGLRSEIFKKNQELDALMLEPNAELEKAKKIQEEISALQSQMEQKKLLAEFEVRKTFTPDQLKQLPPGCDMGIGMCGRGCGMMPPGCGMGRMGRDGPAW